MRTVPAFLAGSNSTSPKPRPNIEKKVKSKERNRLLHSPEKKLSDHKEILPTKNMIERVTSVLVQKLPELIK